MLFRTALLLLLANGLWAERVHLLLKTPGRASERILAAQGIQLIESLGNGEWIVAAERNSPGARLAQPIPLERKLSESLREVNPPAWAQVHRRGEDGLELLVYFHKDVSADQAQSELDRLGAQIVDRSDYFERLTIQLRTEDLKTVAGMDWVKFVEPVFPPLKLNSNADSAALLKVKELHEQFAIEGAGARVAVVDDPVATHPEFGTRLKLMQTSAGLVHGTHVAGTIAAAGTTDIRLRGMAPAAQIISFGSQTIAGGIAANLNAKQREQADISNNSWGALVLESLNNCNSYGNYAAFDREVDTIVYQEKYPLVFAAGNDRNQETCLVSARAGFYSSPPPSSAKNLITVGAVDIGNAISQFSSFGPTRDGRLKPDVVALGVDVLSTSTRNSVATLSGTSMSAPAVTGLSALLIDRFRSKHGRAPAPELLRAFLLNTANDLGNPGPDYSYGYGIPDGVKAVKAIDEDHWRTGAISSGETKEFDLELPGGQPTLRVMLAWTDPPAPLGRTRQLMNDLDLKLVGPEGQTVQPMILDPLRPEMDARSGENVLDNVEQVVVQVPSGGLWKLVVSAKELAVGPQDFAISWTTAENPAPACTTTVYPTNLTIRETAATIAVQVARSSVCDAWTAADSPDWILLGEPTNNRASGLVKLRVAGNDTGQSRRTTLQVAGRAVTIRQNTVCATNELKPGEDVTGVLDENDCLQEGTTSTYYTKVYTFRAEAGQRMTIQANSRTLDAYLILIGPGGAFLAADDDSGGGLNSRIPGTGSLAVPLTGTYRLLMTTALQRETGDFTLRLNLEAGSGNAAELPKVISACPAEIDGELTSNSSKLGRRGDLYNTDVYTFEGRIGQPVKLVLAEAAFDAVLYLLSPTGQTLALADDTDGNLPRIESTLPANGIYRVEVSSYSPFAAGTYKFQASGCSEWSIR
jgi:hypothetical protein